MYVQWVRGCVQWVRGVWVRGVWVRGVWVRGVCWVRGYGSEGGQRARLNVGLRV